MAAGTSVPTQPCGQHVGKEWRWWEMRGESRGCFVAGVGNTTLYSTARKKYLLEMCYSSSLLLFPTSVVCRIISGAG